MRLTKQELKQAKTVLEKVNPLQAVKAELFEQFGRDGDPTGDIHRQIALADSVWKHFIIAVDNGKD